MSAALGQAPRAKWHSGVTPSVQVGRRRTLLARLFQTNRGQSGFAAAWLEERVAAHFGERVTSVENTKQFDIIEINDYDDVKQHDEVRSP
jgi:hypothetical protein